MSRSLQQRVEQVQTTAKRLMWLYGLTRFGLAILLTIVSLGLIDYFLGLHGSMPRWLLSIAAMAASIVAFIKMVWPVFRFRLDPVATAQRIEFRFPERPVEGS